MSKKEGICEDCGEIKVLLCRNLCKKCYMKWTYHNSKMTYIENSVDGERIELNIERDVLTAKDATKYIKFKREQILNDAIRNPDKYLKGK